MSETDFQPQAFDDLDLPFPWEALGSNKRVAIRYLRSDIKAVVKVHSFFFPRVVQVVLRDISSRGAGILSPKKLNKNCRVSLMLLFTDGKRFEIEGIIIHSKKSKMYGLKFKNYQEELADHLLHTQTDLKFS